MILIARSSSYELPHRIHAAAAYPIKSPNGSTIIIYGHERGIRFLWKGGRPFKPQYSAHNSEEKPKPNGSGNDAVMIIDSDDEDPVPTNSMPEKHEGDAVFEKEDGQWDSSEPYDPIIQTLELPLGTGVLHISFMYLPQEADRTGLDSLPKLLSQRIVLSLICSDCTVRLLVLPLTPPTPMSKKRVTMNERGLLLGAGKGSWGEEMIVISSNGHQSIPKGSALTYTLRVLEEENDVDVEGHEEMEERRSRHQHGSVSRSRSRSRQYQATGEWDILLASHSTDFGGLLLVHRLPLTADGTAIDSMLVNHIPPWQTVYLNTFATSISFSTSLYPSSRHSQLLITGRKGVARVYDCLAQSECDEGSWLISLHSAFETIPGRLPERKAILDAKWILGGKAVLVLLANGEWGIWDLEGAGPKIKNDIRDPSQIGISLDRFAVCGIIARSPELTNKMKSSSGKIESQSQLAPMTPATRKVRQEALFTKPTPTSDEKPARGGLHIIPAVHMSNQRADDETILIWHGENIISIPSLLTHWQNKVKGTDNLFDGGAQGQPKEIKHVNMGGELRNGVSLMPMTRLVACSGVQSDQVLVTGESRLIIITPPLDEPTLTKRIFVKKVPSSTDQRLLARGELDVGGMNRVLSGMTNGDQSNGIVQNGKVLKRKVGFSIS